MKLLLLLKARCHRVYSRKCADVFHRRNLPSTVGWTTAGRHLHAHLVGAAVEGDGAACVPALDRLRADRALLLWKWSLEAAEPRPARRRTAGRCASDGSYRLLHSNSDSASCFVILQFLLPGFILKEAPPLPVFSSAPSSSVVVAVVSSFASRRRLRLALFWLFFSLVSSARLPRKVSH